MIKDLPQLGIFLKAEASRTGTHLAFDTHFDAQNWQLSWWRNTTFHRLNFQPLENGRISITHYRDHFRFFPRLLRWAHCTIPNFPYMARIEWINKAMEQFPLEEEEIKTIVSSVVDA
jgi:hypothetical protein